MIDYETRYKAPSIIHTGHIRIETRNVFTFADWLEIPLFAGRNLSHLLRFSRWSDWLISSLVQADRNRSFFVSTHLEDVAVIFHSYPKYIATIINYDYSIIERDF